MPGDASVNDSGGSMFAFSFTFTAFRLTDSRRPDSALFANSLGARHYANFFIKWTIRSTSSNPKAVWVAILLALAMCTSLASRSNP